MTDTIIPAPLHTTTHDGGGLSIAPGAAVLGGPDLADTLQVFVDDVARDTGLRLAVNLNGTGPQPHTAATIQVELITSGPAAEELAALPEPGGLRADNGDPTAERYGLEVSGAHARVWAATPEGVHRGLTSLRQLLTAGLQPDGTAQLPPLRVLDTPRYAWRGLSLDVARTFHDADQVLRVLDILSLHKLNVLHLHLTDDQGWRVPITNWPALTEVGGTGALGDRPGGWYTAEDIDRIVTHARQRHITVVPEIDMPGHCQAVFRSYPELAPATGNAVPDPDPASVPVPVPVGNLAPHREITWRFVEDVLTDVARLFPDSAYLHLGGDEAFGMPDEAHIAFVDRARHIARSLGRHVVGWQETARSAVGPQEVVQYWIDAAEMREALDSGALAQMMPAETAAIVAATMAKAEHDIDRAADKGASILLSPTSHLYLDRPYAEPGADADDEARRARVGLPVYPPKTVEQIYDWAPDSALAAATDREAAVAGVEAALWCETVTSGEDLEFLLLPRLAGIAERAWSPSGAGTWDDYRGRLAVQSAAWHRRNWTWFASTLIDWPSHPARNEEA
ncbi:family 20 glycosylhydrolase [Streptomyces sp. NPDC058751]|uniref:family 20 glycosylhydrolase n=1 Tax=Streptomyces sp. NPDC058751 TaxID=3346623 RepID=UPI00368D7358